MGVQTPPPPATSPVPPVMRPPLPASASAPAPSRAQQAAKAAWMAPLVVIIFNFLLKNVGPDETGTRTLVVALFSLVLYVAGFVLAIYALTQVRSAGKNGVLAPGLVGLLLNGILLLLVIAVAVSSFKAARSRRQGQGASYPVLTSTNSQAA